ncbi:hypothetical protein WJX84_005553 [Apatococcus fuscideae]|uniref:Uncharacterized protein n=1 Tax=Apatococcus fuscideae TaxID=2026836 RepID=A0AAW1T9H6_9CHLO
MHSSYEEVRLGLHRGRVACEGRPADTTVKSEQAPKRTLKDSAWRGSWSWVCPCFSHPTEAELESTYGPFTGLRQLKHIPADPIDGNAPITEGQTCQLVQGGNTEILEAQIAFLSQLAAWQSGCPTTMDVSSGISQYTAWTMAI